MSLIRSAGFITCSAAVSLLALTLLLGADAAPAKEPPDTRTLIGKPAPPFSLQTTAGKDMALASEKGNVVLLDFWATWCPPCRASLPHLEQVYEDQSLKEKGLRVYAINQGEDKKTAKDFCDQNGLKFPGALDKVQAVGNRYLVRGIPTTVVIGRDGKVKNAFIGFGEGLEERIRKVVDSALDAPKPDPTTRPAAKKTE